ncbi:hypothetical protein BKA70DRAFT_1335390 [Coprinopsis sp. MPI-PUGE-AT-0042]|nr:hypothetical protein BKA70DRAFT_1335390 [Coprinopsis sp. MPI-PUGE-AT-0042]
MKTSIRIAYAIRMTLRAHHHRGLFLLQLSIPFAKLTPAQVGLFAFGSKHVNASGTEAEKIVARMRTPASGNGFIRMDWIRVPQLPTTATSLFRSSAYPSQHLLAAPTDRQSTRERVREERLRQHTTQTQSSPFADSANVGEATEERERLTSLYPPHELANPCCQLHRARCRVLSHLCCPTLTVSGGTDDRAERRWTCDESEMAGLPHLPFRVSATSLPKRLRSVRSSSNHPRHQPITLDSCFSKSSATLRREG